MITIDEAIRRLENNDLLFWKSAWEQDREAIKLGIEALKFVVSQRTGHTDLYHYRLLGETKE